MKQKVVHLRAVFFSGNSNNGANAGVRNANTNNSAANANANNGSHLSLLVKKYWDDGDPATKNSEN